MIAPRWNRLWLVASLLAVTLFVTPAPAAVTIQDLIVDQGSITSGDKLFDQFTFSSSGDMPTADQVEVIAITGANGDFGIRFFGGFVDVADDATSVLSVGYLLPVSQNTVLKILIGLDRHGIVAKWSLIIIVFSGIAGMLVANRIGWSVVVASFVVVVPLSLGLGVVVLVQALKALDISFRDYYTRVLREVIYFTSALVLALAAAKAVSPFSSGVNILLAVFVTCAVSVLLLRKDIAKFTQQLAN